MAKLSVLKLASMQSLSLDCTLRTKKVTARIFGNVRCPILRTKPIVRCSGGAA